VLKFAEALLASRIRFTVSNIHCKYIICRLADFTLLTLLTEFLEANEHTWLTVASQTAQNISTPARAISGLHNKQQQ